MHACKYEEKSNSALAEMRHEGIEVISGVVSPACLAVAGEQPGF